MPPAAWVVAATNAEFVLQRSFKERFLEVEATEKIKALVQQAQQHEQAGGRQDVERARALDTLVALAIKKLHTTGSGPGSPEAESLLRLRTVTAACLEQSFTQDKQDHLVLKANRF